MIEYMVFFIKDGKKLKKKVVDFTSKDAKNRIIREYGEVEIKEVRKVSDEGLNYLKKIMIKLIGYIYQVILKQFQFLKQI